MQDIGGCRAILPGGETEIRAVVRRITRNWDVTRIYDYMIEPKETGYRGIHAVAMRDDRLIEIQLRSPGQHEWALAVERTAGRLRMPELKDGIGPPELVRYFNRAAYAIALQEHGSTTDKAFDREFKALREEVDPYFQRPGR
jgi:ppGpp synthetase/RelA/SpoT-type nucleotidyltranferase